MNASLSGGDRRTELQRQVCGAVTTSRGLLWFLPLLKCYWRVGGRIKVKEREP